jgi:predicted RNA-binding Zn ribbon-like protein
MTQTMPDWDAVQAPVATVLEFVNTRLDVRGRTERFGSADAFAEWAREHELLDGEPVTESDAAAARELRTAVLALLRAHSPAQDIAADELRDAEAQLAHAADRYPVKVVLSAGGSSIGGSGRGAAGVFGEVLAAAGKVAQHGDWARLKACCSDPCQHAFVDRTKNGAQMYCDSVCSSRAAMRAMRERRRATRADRAADTSN